MSMLLSTVCWSRGSSSCDWPSVDFCQSDVAEKQGVRLLQGGVDKSWEGNVARRGLRGPEGNSSWFWEGSGVSMTGVVGEGQGAVGWCGFQDRAVLGCGHGSGWQKGPGSEGQLDGGRPGKKIG